MTHIYESFKSLFIRVVVSSPGYRKSPNYNCNYSSNSIDDILMDHYRSMDDTFIGFQFDSDCSALSANRRNTLGKPVREQVLI